MVETQLKSAIQSHFISVSSCMEQLKEINSNLNEVKTTIYSIQDEYKTIAHLENTLSELRREANKHKQVHSKNKQTNKQVKSIFDVDFLIEFFSFYFSSNRPRKM